MSYKPADFQAEVALEAGIFKGWYANTKAELTLLATALSTDATTHDRTIETPLGILGTAATRFQAAMNLIINKGKGGNLTPAQMGTAITAVAATLP